MIKQPYFQPNLKPNIVYKQNIFNLSVSYADSSLYQREPCCSFGLKCRFTTEQVYQREPILLKIIGL